MKKYIITYCLRNTSKDYFPLYEAIKVNMPEYKHITESAWIVNTDKTAKEIRDLLVPYLYFTDHTCDMLFVGEINKENVDGMLAKSCWPFITDKEDKENKENDKD